MNTQSPRMIIFSLLILLIVSLAACQRATPTPERVVETVVITQIVEGEPVEVIVTPTPDPAAELPPTGEGEIIPAEELKPCLPIPELEFGSHLSARLASLMPTSFGSAASSPQNKLVQAAQEVNESYYGQLQTSPAQQSDQVYRVGVFEDVTSLNFWQANGPDNTIWNAYMLPPRLALYGLSEKYFQIVPVIAAVTASDPLVQEGDFWVVSIPIRQDIQWSDGTPLTARDVAFTANTSLRFQLFAGNWQQWYDGNFLSHVEAADDYTVKYFYHTKPGMARHDFGTLQAPILAEHYWAPVADEAAAPLAALPADASEAEQDTAAVEAMNNLFAHAPDGEPTAGSFHFTRWEPGAFLDNSANDDYYLNGLVIENYANGAYVDSEGIQVGSPEGQPETVIEVGPHVSSVVYSIYSSQDAAILALRNGEVDFVLNSLGLQRGLADQIRDDPALSVIENPANQFRYLSFNNRRQPMNDCSFRQAVAVLIDKEFVSSTILQGTALPRYTYVAPANAAWYFEDVPKLGEGLNREQRMQLAIAILEQAGYTWQGDQKPTWDPNGNSVIPGASLIMPDGTPVPQLELWAPSAGYDPLRTTFAIWIESWLNEMGIPTRAQLAGFNILIPRIFTQQDFDMYILGWSLGIFPSYLRDFYSAEQAAPGGNNAGGYVSEVFEELSFRLLTCETEEECRPISEEIQQLLAIEMPNVVLFDTGIIEAFRSASVEYPYTEQLSGLQYTHIGGGVLQAGVKTR